MRLVFIALTLTLSLFSAACVEDPAADADHVVGAPPAFGEARCKTNEQPPRYCTAKCPAQVTRTNVDGQQEQCWYSEQATRLRTDFQCFAGQPQPEGAAAFQVHCYYQCANSAGDYPVLTPCLPGAVVNPNPGSSPTPGTCTAP